MRFFLLLVSIFSLFSEAKGEPIRIAKVQSIEEIDLAKGRDILVRSFMTGYEEVPLADLNLAFRSIADVRRFYEDYFESELRHFEKGELVWVQAFVEDRLVGWATFELETEKSAYMNLLVVDPDEWGKGIGKELTFSICSLAHVEEINLLIRRVNEGGRKFYEKIGFTDYVSRRPDNFVDLSLLTGLRWCEKREGP